MPLQIFEFNLERFIAIAFAVISCSFVVDRLVRVHYREELKKYINKDKLLSDQRKLRLIDERNLLEKKIAKDREDSLNLEFGAVIGKIERLFYVYSIVYGHFALLGAWIVLKAFFGWIRTDQEVNSHERITMFYFYIYGNALSLLYSLVFTHIGFTLPPFLKFITEPFISSTSMEVTLAPWQVTLISLGLAILVSCLVIFIIFFVVQRIIGFRERVSFRKNRIDINQASQTELLKIDRIGRSRAKTILELRQSGRYIADLDDLKTVLNLNSTDMKFIQNQGLIYFGKP